MTGAQREIRDTGDVLGDDQGEDLGALLEAVASGDRGAFRVLYDQSVPILFAICLRLMRDRELARDTLQEAMLKIWHKAHLFDASKGKAMAWMAVVTRNCALSRLACHAPPTESLDEDSVLAKIEAHGFDDPAPGIDIRRCIGQLPEHYRKAILSIYFQGLTYDELAISMDAPVGTVKTWIHRAVRDLAACRDHLR
jgi:RNA polymerase sigma-70 factor (ECF subfamily)